MTDDTSILAPLEAKSPMLFLVAGGLLVVFAANTGARTLADGGVPAIHSIVGPAGFFVGLVGLLGLYPGLADDGAILGRLAGIVAAIPLVGWFVITVWGIGHAIGVLPDMSVVFPGPAVIVVFLTTMLAYILFSVACLRSRSYSLSVGLAVVAPAVPFLTLILVVQALQPIEWAEFVIDSGHALAYLVVGLAIRDGVVPSTRTEPTPDATP